MAQRTSPDKDDQTQGYASLMAKVAMVLTVLSMAGASLATEAPAPSPVASAGAVSPSFAVGCLVTVALFLFGSALRT
ncbi:hypothetical protein U1Q18_018875 [Sarracenia purpurea var. burkii]